MEFEFFPSCVEIRATWNGVFSLFKWSSEIWWQVNGEIYNHEVLKAGMKAHKYNTQSDCEVIAHLVSDFNLNYD